MLVLVICIVYINGVLLNTGALLASFQGDSFGSRRANIDYRFDLGIASLLSLIPLVWFVTPFVTGFYEHGWQLGRKD